MPLHVHNNDDDLLIRLNDGDRFAFAAVYEKMFPTVAIFAKRFVGADLAHDITAEVFIRLWKQEKKFENMRHLVSSLRMTARNLCIDKLRSDKLSRTRIEELQYLSNEKYEDIYFQDAVKSNLYSQIIEEIDKLPPYLRQVFNLSFIDGLSNAEIAAKLNIKDSSVRTKKSQALEILRRKLSNLQIALLISILFSDWPG